MRILNAAGVAALLLINAAAAHAGLHDKWDAVMKSRNNDGWVEYAALKADSTELDAYLAELAAVPAPVEKAWPREERLAFWINAYNAFTIRAILDNYPISRGSGLSGLRYPANSIRQIPGVWDKLEWKAAGRELTLNDMEHKILRKELSEPRIHFAIVCASIGCPTLRSEVYTASRLEEQLEDNARRFVESDRILIDRKRRTAGLSPILKWFNKDFARFNDGSWDRYPKKFRGPLAFLSSYLKPRDVLGLRQKTFSTSWLDYDWSLNDAANRP